MRGMGADEEVRQHAGTRAAAAAVVPEHLAGEEQGAGRDGAALEAQGLDDGQAILQPVEADREFGEDDVVDEKRAAQRGGFLHVLRPVRPAAILPEQIEQEVGVNQRHPNPRRA